MQPVVEMMLWYACRSRYLSNLKGYLLATTSRYAYRWLTEPVHAVQCDTVILRAGLLLGTIRAGG